MELFSTNKLFNEKKYEEILALVDKKCDSLTELQAQLTELLEVCGD